MITSTITSTIHRLAATLEATRRGLTMSMDPGAFAMPDGCLDDLDPIAQMAQADAADRSLLRLVLCAAGATLVLALATSLV